MAAFRYIHVTALEIVSSFGNRSCLQYIYVTALEIVSSFGSCSCLQYIHLTAEGHFETRLQRQSHYLLGKQQHQDYDNSCYGNVDCLQFWELQLLTVHARNSTRDCLQF